MSRYLGGRVAAVLLVLVGSFYILTGAAFAEVDAKLDSADSHAGKAIEILQSMQGKGHNFKGHVKEAIDALQAAQRQIDKARKAVD